MTGTRPGKKKPSRKITLSGLTDGRPVVGVAALLVAVLAVSALAGLRFSEAPKVYLAGEIAGADIAADQDLLVEDTEGTEARRRQLAEAQPPVFDLTVDPYLEMERGVYQIFDTVNRAEKDKTEETRWAIAETLDAEVNKTTYALWTREDFQNLVLGRVLPWLKRAMEDGVVKDRAALAAQDKGILVRDLQSGRETLVVDPQELADVPSMMSELDHTLKRDLRKSLFIRKGIQAITAPLARPSLSRNDAETALRRREVRQTVEPVFYSIKKGEMVVRKGESVSPEQQMKLQALFSRHKAETFALDRASGIFILTCLFLLGLVLCVRLRLTPRPSSRDLAVVALVLLVFGILARFLVLVEVPMAEDLGLSARDLFPYSLPVAGAAGVLAMFFPYPVCLSAVLALSFACAATLDGGLLLMSYYYLGAVLAVFLVKQSQTRTELIRLVFPLAGGMVTAWAGVNLLSWHGPTVFWAGGLYVLAGGVFSLLAILGVSPLVEWMFRYTSRFKLMELMNLEQPLLQELMVSAPGTYHHSLILSNMVEAGARAIGANALLAKVAALYHDIGKLKNPHYFIENQFGGENRHDKLSPSMSALILISHVKKGVELAREHKLGEELSSLISQHHGTTLISYFYNKACEQAGQRGETVREEDFRYPGPKPQTKEAGLILLADAIEASSRALSDTSPSRLKGHIEGIIKKIFSDGQLDESALTLKDLHLLSDIFHRILTGIFHQRIEYPEKGRDKSGGDKDKAADRKSDAESGEASRYDPARAESTRQEMAREDGADMSGRSKAEGATVLKFSKRRGGSR